MSSRQDGKALGRLGFSPLLANDNFRLLDEDVLLLCTTD
jgi:hypothetical protein